MLLIDDILCSPFNGILWIFREINKVAQEELDGESQSITEQLRLLYMQLETGRIDEQQFDSEETLLLDRLDALNSRLKKEDEEESEEMDVVEAGDETANR
jgi:Gas vesicle protein G